MCAELIQRRMKNSKDNNQEMGERSAVLDRDNTHGGTVTTFLKSREAAPVLLVPAGGLDDESDDEAVALAGHPPVRFVDAPHAFLDDVAFVHGERALDVVVVRGDSEAVSDGSGLRLRLQERPAALPFFWGEAAFPGRGERGDIGEQVLVERGLVVRKCIFVDGKRG